MTKALRALGALILLVPALALAQVHGSPSGAASTVLPGAFPLLATDGTSSAPSYSFSTATGVGEWLGGISFGASGTADVFLVRDAANALAQRNSTTAQSFRVYGTFTDASNYERLTLSLFSGGYMISSDALGTGTARPLYLGVGGAAKWDVEQTTGHFKPITDNAVDFGDSTHRIRNFYNSGGIKIVGGITTAGLVGTPAIVATGRATAQAAANASVSTFTVGAADASFEVSSNVLITASTTFTFTVTVAYTDEGNTGRVLTLNFSNVGGTIATTIANAGGAVPYEGIVQHIRAKAATTITCATTGTFTTVTYNVECIIKQTA